jgi:nucleoid-associated protein YgaU
MKNIMMGNAVWLGVVILVAGCAATPEQPLPAAPREAAQEAPVVVPPVQVTLAPAAVKPAPVTAAEVANTISAARMAVDKALARDALWRDTGDMLDKARRLFDDGALADAKAKAEQALFQADAALAQSYEEDAKFLVAYLRADFQAQMTLNQRTRLEAADSALTVHKGQMAYDTAALLLNELKTAPAPAAEPAPVPAPQPVLTHYTVARGDTLRAIAAKPEVYGNPDMWPLLLKANQDKIQQADRIPVGLELRIDRNATPEAVAAAIAHSKKRGAPILGPVQAFDQKYLGR